MAYMERYALHFDRVAGVLLPFLMAAPLFAQDIIYVDAAQIAPGDGSSWTLAMSDLQAALLSAQPTDEIRVAAGTYRPDQGTDDRQATFDLPDAVVVRGGYAGLGASDPDARDPLLYETILTGEIGDPGLLTDNSYHVVTAIGVGAATVLDGFVIEKGCADAGYPDDNGAGIFLNGGALTVTACRLQDHFAASIGAGLHAANNAAPHINSCLFLRNECAGTGGGAYFAGGHAVLVACTFSNNRGEISGGALAGLSSNLSLVGCTLIDNSTEFNGAGAYCLGGQPGFESCTFVDNLVLNSLQTGNDGGGGFYGISCDPVFTDCVFQSNLANDYGGGVYLSNCSATLRRCVFTDNTATHSGGGVYVIGQPAMVENCLLNGNTALNRGGGMYNGNTYSTVRHCTFHLNISYGTAGGVYLAGSGADIDNCIFWNNDDTNGNGLGAQITDTGGSADVDYCCIQNLGAAFGGAGNIADNPLFIDADGPDNIPSTGDDNLRPAYTSPCLDAGDPAYMPSAGVTDLAGNDRLSCAGVDMGCYEKPVLWGDFDCTWRIDQDDYLLFATCLTGANIPHDQSPLCSEADWDADGDVDLSDFAALQRCYTSIVGPPELNCAGL